MSKKTIIITGANTGIGFEAARILCRSGDKYEVILACRSEEKAQAAVKAIKEESPSADVMFMKLDLASLDSVRQFVDNFLATGKKLHVLCNNAGMANNFSDNVRHLTKDGFEMTMGTNHFGHFLLTNLLLDKLKSTATSDGEARIVVTSSGMHDINGQQNRKANMQLIDLDDLNSEKKYLGQQAYKDSKLANVMFTLELARRLQGTGVTVNCLCPGFIPNTEFLRNNGTFIRGFCRYIIGGLMRPFLKITRTVEEGGQAIVQLAVDEKLAGQTGKFFRDFVEDKVSVEATKEQDQQRLWQISEKMVGLESYQGMD